jgi:hypothetical protein
MKSGESYEVMQARMQKAFNLVVNKEHWKLAVKAEVTSTQLEEAGLTIEEVVYSVGYFTGTPATSKLLYTSPSMYGTKFYLVTAPGYYAGPCN